MLLFLSVASAGGVPYSVNKKDEICRDCKKGIFFTKSSYQWYHICIYHLIYLDYHQIIVVYNFFKMVISMYNKGTSPKKYAVDKLSKHNKIHSLFCYKPFQ